MPPAGQRFNFHEYFRHTHLDTEFVFLVDLAIDNAFNFRAWTQACFCLFLQGKHPFREFKPFVEFSMQVMIMQNFPQNIPVYPTKVGLQPPDLLFGTFKLPSMSVECFSPQSIGPSLA